MKFSLVAALSVASLVAAKPIADTASGVMQERKAPIQPCYCIVDGQPVLCPCYPHSNQKRTPIGPCACLPGEPCDCHDPPGHGPPPPGVPIPEKRKEAITCRCIINLGGESTPCDCDKPGAFAV